MLWSKLHQECFEEIFLAFQEVRSQRSKNIHHIFKKLLLFHPELLPLNCSQFLNAEQFLLANPKTFNAFLFLFFILVFFFLSYTSTCIIQGSPAVVYMCVCHYRNFYIAVAVPFCDVLSLVVTLHFTLSVGSLTQNPYLNQIIAQF